MKSFKKSNIFIVLMIVFFLLAITTKIYAIGGLCFILFFISFYYDQVEQ